MEIMLYVSGQELLIEDVAESLVYATEADALDFKEVTAMRLPRSVRMQALRKVLEAPLKTEKNDALRRIQDGGNTLKIADSKRVERLKWFQDFSECQLEIELANLKDEGLTREYLRILWLELLKAALRKDVDKGELEKFCDRVVTNEEKLPEIKQFNEAMNALFKDDEGFVDGLIVETFKEVLPYSSSVKELVQIGKKLGIKVPTNLKKGEVCVLIEEELKAKGMYDKKEHAVLKTYTLKQLEAFAREHDIIASGYVTKTQAVEYILRHYHPGSAIVEEKKTQHEETLEDLMEPLKEEVKEPRDEASLTPVAVKEEGVDEGRVDALIMTKSLEQKLDALTQAMTSLEAALKAQSAKAIKRQSPVKRLTVGLVAVVFVFFLYIGVSYLFDGYRPFEFINRYLNRIPAFYNYGLVDFFHRGIERFILRQ